MHADHAVDDELEPREAHALVRQPRELECAVGIADVHRNLHRNLGQRVELDVALIEFQHAVDT